MTDRRNDERLGTKGFFVLPETLSRPKTLMLQTVKLQTVMSTPSTTAPGVEKRIRTLSPNGLCGQEKWAVGRGSSTFLQTHSLERRRTSTFVVTLMFVAAKDQVKQVNPNNT